MRRAGRPGWAGRVGLDAEGVGIRDGKAVRDVAGRNRVITAMCVVGAAVAFFLDVYELAIGRHLAVLAGQASAVEGRESEQPNEIAHNKLRGLLAKQAVCPIASCEYLDAGRAKSTHKMTVDWIGRPED